MGGSEAIRVLVCDDSPPLRKLVELQLKDDDRFAAVEQASAAEDCLSAVQRQAPDVILLDHGVQPEQQWREFLAQLRQAAPATRIVLFSGLPSPLLKDEVKERGLDGFLEKGQPAADLRRELAALVGGAGQAE